MSNLLYNNQGVIIKTFSISDEIKTISESLEKLVIKESSNYDINSIEENMNTLLNKIRKTTTENIIQKQDVKKHECSICSQKMIIKEKKEKKIQGIVEYSVRRRSFYCQKCKTYETPLDEIIQCKGTYSLQIHKAIILLGQRLPFEESSNYLKELLSVNVSAPTIRSLTETIGEKIAEDDYKNTQNFIKKSSKLKTNNLPTIDDTAYLQMDGCMVQTRELKWKEVKNGVLFSKSDIARTDKNHRTLLLKKYFSVFNNGDSSLKLFKDRLQKETHEYKFDSHKHHVIIGDGAPWIWDYAAEHHPYAIEILDYYHAAEYLSTALNAIQHETKKKKKVFDKKLKSYLWEGNIFQLILRLEKHSAFQEIKQCIRYYQNHISRMKYGEYRAKGFEIGSGTIESSHRIIVHTRMKLSGMHWGKNNVQSMLSLRAKYLSGEWNYIVNNYMKKAV